MWQQICLLTTAEYGVLPFYIDLEKHHVSFSAGINTHCDYIRVKSGQSLVEQNAYRQDANGLT